MILVEASIILGSTQKSGNIRHQPKLANSMGGKLLVSNPLEKAWNYVTASEDVQKHPTQQHRDGGSGKASATGLWDEIIHHINSNKINE